MYSYIEPTSLEIWLVLTLCLIVGWMIRKRWRGRKREFRPIHDVKVKYRVHRRKRTIIRGVKL